jgi:hypothetical protein
MTNSKKLLRSTRKKSSKDYFKRSPVDKPEQEEAEEKLRPNMIERE